MGTRTDGAAGWLLYMDSSSAAPVLLSRCLFTNFRLKYPGKQVLFRDTFGDEDDAGRVTAKGINKT